MNTIKIVVRDKIAVVIDETTYICGNSDFAINFDFDAEWDKLDAKTARFSYEGKYQDVVFTGTECPVPIISNTHKIYVGVFAGNLHTTTPAYIPAKKSILCGFGSPEAPSEDVYAQIMELLNSLGGASPEAVAAAVAEYMAKHPVAESDPTVPTWAKAASKPSYTKSEVGLGNVDNVRQYSANNPPPYPVTSVNGKTGPVVLDADSVGAEKSGAASSSVSEHNTKTDTHNDIRLLISALTNRLDALANSDDKTLDQMAEVVAYIKANRELIESVTTGKVSVVDIVDNLTTNVTNKPLSAAQGVALKVLIDAITVPTKLSQLYNDKGYITSYTETDPTVPEWAKSEKKPTYTADEVGAISLGKLGEATETVLRTAKESGEFDGAPGAPGYTPQRGTDYWTADDQAAIVQEVLDELPKLPEGDGGSVEIVQTTGDSETAVMSQKAVTDALANLDHGGATEPADDDIPKVYFIGVLPISKADGELKGKLRYKSKTGEFSLHATLKVQGDSSVHYPKKNFTLKMFEDSECEIKAKKNLKGWGEMSKFVLKAHWIDHSHVRNVGTAKLWGQVVRSRADFDSLPEELRTAPNCGATDGFTVKFFANGIYQGLYEWIVPKDKLFGQDSDIATHSILNSEFNNQPTCAFATTEPTISGNWSEELQDSMSSDISTSFANAIRFVAESTDAEFLSNAENYFDVQSVIDYDIFARIFCVVDNLCKNQIFFTYDGVKWYEGAWDLDAVLGLPPTVRGFFAYNTEFQSGYVAYTDYGVTNRLYQRIETVFRERFKARYDELRHGVLAVDNIVDVYERLTDTITTYDGLLDEDFAATTAGGAFTGIPYTAENTIQQIREFVVKRTIYMDGIILDEQESNDDFYVADSFANSTWTNGFYGDSGAIEQYPDLNMCHSQLMVADKMFITVQNKNYLRVSYFDTNKNYIGWDRGYGVGVPPPDSNIDGGLGAVEIFVDPTRGTYFAVSYNSTNKGDVVIVPAKGQFDTAETPIAYYTGSDHGSVNGEWKEKNRGSSIALTGCTWNEGILSTDGIDDNLVLPLTNAKTVVIKAKLLSDYSVDKKARYVFDCRPTATVYLLNYVHNDYVGSDARCYVGTRNIRSESGFANHVNIGEWYYFTVVFESEYTGDMFICTHHTGNSDFMQAEIEEIKVYDVDITDLTDLGQ